jgi:heme/copper-type cytochrome/quinol oxidase subunit 3
MHPSLMVERATSIVERIVMLAMELAVAAAVIFGAIFVGHELREWRDWYWAAYLHPADAPAPAAEVTEP